MRPYRSDRTPAVHLNCESDAESQVNIGFEENLSERWREAALSGNLALAWSISDELLRSKVDCSRLERWRRPLWDGSPIDGRNVMIRCWRGLGDAIHFIRYAPLVKERAYGLTVESPPALIPLFRTISSIDRLLVLDSDCVSGGDYVQIESTELPYLFRTTLASIPCAVPYLRAFGCPPVPHRRMRSIGLCWSSGPFDNRRSMRLAEFEALRRLPDTRFFQLQRGPAHREIVRSSLVFQNSDDSTMDLLCTAFLINSLDLIISVDTMVAHLAGALGRSTFLLVHTDADWRWFRYREDSPWYPTMRILRQSEAGKWKPVVERLVELL
jgi:hypothetical protein